MRLIATVALLFCFAQQILANTCGGNCPSNTCDDCKCGTEKNMVAAAEWCAKWSGWNQAMCQCIVSHESGGNANACGKNTDSSYDVGLWQINSFNWASCSGGSAPCDPAKNLECAKKVYAWGGNTFKLWSTCGACNCLSGLEGEAADLSASQKKKIGSTGSSWTLQSQTQSTVLVGVARGGPNGANALAPAAQNGVGAVIYSYDGSSWDRQSGSNANVQSGLLMGAAISPDATLKVVTSMLPVFVSDNSDTYTTVPNVGGTIQSASVFNTNSIGVVGSLVVAKKSINGVAFSTDRGVTWSASPVPSGFTRYGDFIDSNNWLVSAGIWGDDNTTTTTTLHTHAPDADFSLSKRIRAGKGRKPTNGDSSSGDTNANGWLASVSKSTDGGKTWTEVLRGPEGSMYYFNGISCSGSTCVVVGEGETANGDYLTVAFSSNDGGSTWSQTLNSDMYSLMAVVMTSSTNGWLAGAVHSITSGMVGQFYTTTDSGASWQLAQTLADCYPISMSFADGQGVAACISSSGSSAQAALFNA